MKISVAITVFNEAKTIAALLDSLLLQTKKAEQIIFVDGGSKDATVEIIRHYQRKDGRIKLLVEKCSRAKGRNLGCEIAKEDIIAMTDAGCIPDKNWLKNLTSPFENTNVDVVAGFYRMTGNTTLQKTMSMFLGVLPNNFDAGFLPSTRSIAFTKSIWEKVDGFPEGVKGAAEDTVFNYKLIKAGAKFSRMKNATVEWGMPESLTDFFWKIFNYSKGDIKSKIWNFPGKGLTSHNIKALFVFSRYLVGLTLLVLSIKNHFLLAYLVFGFLIYLIWAYRKIYLEFGDYRIALWGPTLQITSDFGVIGGFIKGFMK